MDAPILSFGETLGVLGVCSREPDRFDESDLRLIEAFASLASVALRNAEAYEESTRQTQVERGFYRIASVLSEPLSAEATLDAVAQAAAEALGGDSAAVLRSRRGRPRLAGAHDLGPDLAGYLRAEAAALTAAARAGKVLASRRLDDDGRFAEGLATRRRAGRVGASCLRSRSSSRPATVSGSSIVFFRGETVFGDEQLELAGARCGRGAGRARAERAVRARAACALARAAARTRRRRARGRARPGQPARPRRPLRRRPARGRAASDPAARGRRGRRARGRRGRRARGRSAHARRRPPGSSATSCRRGRRARSPTSATMPAVARRTRCSPPATRRTSACR